MVWKLEEIESELCLLHEPVVAIDVGAGFSALRHPESVSVSNCEVVDGVVWWRERERVRCGGNGSSA